MIHLTFQYTPEILQEAYTLHYRKNTLLQGRVLLFLGILLIWTGLLLILISRNEGRQVLNYSFVIYGLIIVVIYVWTMKTIGNRMFKRQKGSLQAMDITVTEGSIMMKTEKGEVNIPWENFQFAAASEDIVLLYPTKSSFYIFPKKNFSEGEFDLFFAMLKQKIQTVK